MVTAQSDWIKPQTRTQLVAYKPRLPPQEIVDAWIDRIDYIWFPVATSKATVLHAESTEERFHRLAAEWVREIGSVSSISRMTSHPKYREIIDMGWGVVQFLLADLQKGGFWFTALFEITRVRPFDPSDAGNYPIMTEAWVKWGKWKGII